MRGRKEHKYKVEREDAREAARSTSGAMQKDRSGRVWRKRKPARGQERERGVKIQSIDLAPTAAVRPSHAVV